MWSDLRQDIEKNRRALHLAEADFGPLPFRTNWHHLAERIYQTFCKLEGASKPHWLWSSYKHEWYGLSLTSAPDAILDQLITTETVWFMASDGADFLFYQGKISAIQQLLPELTYLDEYYLINRKYEWLVSVNHHDSLTGTGHFIIKQLNLFTQRSPELLTAAYPA